MEKVLLFPGAFQSVKNYGGHKGVDIWLKGTLPKEIPAAAWYIGHSGGASFIIENLDSIPKGKYIFINPVVRKKNLAAFFWDWLRCFFGEGIKRKRLVNVRHWWHGIKIVLRLLKLDTWSALQKIPKEHIIIIRGIHDDYFCDKKSAELITQHGIALIEVDAGHDWNKNIADAVAKQIR